MIKNKLTKQQQADITWLLIIGLFSCYLIVKIFQFWSDYQETLTWIKSFQKGGNMDKYKYNLIKFILQHTGATIAKIAYLAGCSQDDIPIISISTDFDHYQALVSRKRRIEVSEVNNIITHEIKVKRNNPANEKLVELLVAIYELFSDGR